LKSTLHPVEGNDANDPNAVAVTFIAQPCVFRKSNVG
jgi:hypothetical protein